MSDSVATALPYYHLYSLQLSFVYILCSFEAWKDEQLAQCLTVRWQGRTNGGKEREEEKVLLARQTPTDVTDSTVHTIHNKRFHLSETS